MMQLLRPLALGAAAMLGLYAPGAHAQALTGEPLIRALQNGGYLLIMNQAPVAIPEPGAGRRGGFGGARSSGPPDAGPPAEPEPMLTAEAEAMLIGTRHAIWHFEIPVGAVYTSPVSAAVQQAGEVPFADVAEVAGLADTSARSGWLEAKLGEPIVTGRNEIIVTHADNIDEALGIDDLTAGETVVVRPGDEPAVAGRMPLRQWSVLALELEP